VILQATKPINIVLMYQWTLGGEGLIKTLPGFVIGTLSSSMSEAKPPSSMFSNGEAGGNRCGRCCLIVFLTRSLSDPHSIVVCTHTTHKADKG
jgi:hypothetical protein